jgi:hypothetical protein
LQTETNKTVFPFGLAIVEASKWYDDRRNHHQVVAELKFLFKGREIEFEVSAREHCAVRISSWPGLTPETAEEFNQVARIYSQIACFLEAYQSYEKLNKTFLVSK